MPTYTYRCRECGYEFDKRQRFTDAPLTDCPECGFGRLRKVVNSVGIVFKGNGFYVTDNRNGSSASISKNGKDDVESKESAGQDSTTKDNETKASVKERGDKNKARKTTTEPTA